MSVLTVLYDLNREHIFQSVEVHAVLPQACFFLDKCKKQLWYLCARKF